MREEAKERDHRKLGKRIRFIYGFTRSWFRVTFLVTKRRNHSSYIERYIVDKEISLGYQHVYTPIMADVELYKTSGHWDHYHEDMFPPMDMGDGENAGITSNELSTPYDGL